MRSPQPRRPTRAASPPLPGGAVSPGPAVESPHQRTSRAQRCGFAALPSRRSPDIPSRSANREWGGLAVDTPFRTSSERTRGRNHLPRRGRARPRVILGRLSLDCQRTVSADAYQGQAMNGPSWLRRRTAGTITAPERNGAAPSEISLRVRPRPSDASSVGGRRRPGRFLQPLPLAGALLVLVALVGYWSVYRASTNRTPMLVTAHTLSAGTVLRPNDLRTGELAGDARTISALVPERDLDSVLGHTLATAVPAGAPLPRAALAGPVNASSAFTLVVPRLHALAVALAPGDRVTVLATYGSGSGRAHTKAIARSLQVLSVGGAPSGIDSASASIPVTLALPDPSLASSLALANSIAKIDLLREGGRARTAPIPRASEAEGTGANSA